MVPSTTFVSGVRSPALRQSRRKAAAAAGWPKSRCTRLISVPPRFFSSRSAPSSWNSALEGSILMKEGALKRLAKKKSEN